VRIRLARNDSGIVLSDFYELRACDRVSRKNCRTLKLITRMSKLFAALLIIV